MEVHIKNYSPSQCQRYIFLNADIVRISPEVQWPRLRDLAVRYQILTEAYSMFDENTQAPKTSMSRKGHNRRLHVHTFQGHTKDTVRKRR